MSRLHIADTGLFVAMGQPSNSRYQAVRQFARRNDITFVLPERVYEELTVDDPDIEALPVDDAIDEGWATVAAPLEFSEPIVRESVDLDRVPDGYEAMDEREAVKTIVQVDLQHPVKR
ncbi:hypothetical protein DVK03_18365 [Haloferax sp. Atlit-109R]|nr:hypothetical protein C5B88_15290 [Haloferax sp. Atlit-24N]RLM33615.1 hypothetical protein DVK03_18365 [Haloferax sp. Atlit-109R]RLM40806.1 hypothetical protein DVK04_17965 [Haloferax sp. Atlit-105R]